MIYKDNTKLHENIYIHIKKSTLWKITRLVLSVSTAVYLYISYLWSMKSELWNNGTSSNWWTLGIALNIVIYFIFLVIAVLKISEVHIEW